MQINPYNFRQFQAKAVAEPHMSAWLVFAVTFGFLAWWCTPYVAPSSVALKLPSAHSEFSLKTPPSAFVVYMDGHYIYENRGYNFVSLSHALGGLKNRQSLLIAAPSTAALQDILPLLNKAQILGFREVDFTVKP